MKVRYDKKFLKEINTSVRRFNAKINRLSNKNYNNLPKKMSTIKIKKNAISRKQIREILSKLDNFSKRGGERLVDYGNTKIMKYQLDEIKKHRRRLKRKLNKEIKYYQNTKPTIYGDITDFSLAQMKSTGYTNAIRKKEKLIDVNIDNMGYDDVVEYLNLLEKNDIGYNQNLIFKNNYITMIEQSARLYNINKDDIEEIKEYIQNMSASEFYDYYRQEQGLGQVVFRYSKIMEENDIFELMIERDEIEEEFNMIRDSLKLYLGYM